MTNTEILKQYIESKYPSVRQFTIDIKIPYTTLHSIFRRGIENSSVSNINRICNALKINMQGLLNGEIINDDITIKNSHGINNPEEIIDTAKILLTNKCVLSNGKKLNEIEIENILKIIKQSLV